MLAPRLAPDPALLARLLHTGEVRRASVAQRLALPGKAPLPLGLSGLDAALGGGLARGQIAEVVAQASSGGTALIRSALRQATQAGELCALIDLSDAFDPEGASAEGGVDLRRLLWVRPRALGEALRAAEIALSARFALVVLDLADAPELAARRPAGREGRAGRLPVLEAVRGPSLRLLPEISAPLPARPARKATPAPGSPAWARLSRAAEKSSGAVLVLSRAAQAGPFAAVGLSLSGAGGVWVGQPGSAGRLLEGAQAMAEVVRLRRGAPSAPQPLALRAGAAAR